MNILKTTAIVAVSFIATLSVAAIMGFQLTEITAEEVTRTQYMFVEGVEITADFKFREGEEIVPVQVFTQTKGFGRSEPFIFTMQKIVGNTPFLQQHADESFLFRNSELQKQDYNPFDVEILLATGPYVKRSFSYTDCFIDKYDVTTLRDNEEGYTNKGFAVVENYLIECRSMQPNNPSLQAMEDSKNQVDPTTKSSLDYQLEQRQMIK